ncbi:MAG: CocE/NonD family hydrolase [Ignavibacteriales bacterium]|nr:CocE/NonD family hydrolase [Ignavibacteriales bacterium]
MSISPRQKVISLSFLIVALSALFLSEGRAQDSLYIKEHYSKSEFYITMRDGVRLFTSVYAPRDTTRQFPVILNRTPYSVGPYGLSSTRNRMVPSMNEVREGYIFAYQDVRGKYLSEGTFVDLRPYNPAKKSKNDIDETTDTYDTVDWLVKNLARNNGRVGITGISYPGFYTTMGTIDAHPAVKATSPQAPIADPFVGDDEHHNGAFFLAQNFGFYMFFGHPRPSPTTRTMYSFRPWTMDSYKFFLAMGPLSNANKLYFKDSVAMWTNMMAHETLDEFWKPQLVAPHLKNIKPAVMTVGGWFDQEDMLGPLRTYKEIEKNNPGIANTLVMGPWFHGEWNGDEGERLGDLNWGSKTSLWFQENVQLPFFNYYLKEKGEAPKGEAIVFETGVNVWHQLDSWPPKNSMERRLYLQPKGGLSFDAPKESNDQFTEYVSDPAKPVPHSRDIRPGVSREVLGEDQRFAASRSDVVVFESDKLSSHMTIAGPIVASMEVSTSGTDSDWIVKLIDVFPDDSAGVTKSGVPVGGYQMLVRGDVFRGKFRESLSKPVPFTPNRVTHVEFELRDVLHCFKAGHRMMVQIQSSWFPLVDRNPQTFVNIRTAKETDFRKATQRIYHSAKDRTFLKVLVWEK